MRGTVRADFAKRACGLEHCQVHEPVPTMANKVADEERGGGNPCVMQECHSLQIASVSVIEGHGYDGIDAVPAPIQRLAEANETDAGRLQSLDLAPKQWHRHVQQVACLSRRPVIH